MARMRDPNIRANYTVSRPGCKLVLRQFNPAQLTGFRLPKSRRLGKFATPQDFAVVLLVAYPNLTLIEI